MRNKIGFEEHFNLSQFDKETPQYVSQLTMAEIRARLLDVAETRLQDMDASGIGYSLLSLTAPGVQDVPDPGEAVTLARQANDALAEIVAGTPTRYGGMATLPLQDPQAAVTELERCVTHALRLMTSGLLDRFPNLKIVLGHLGETLTESMREAGEWFDNAEISEADRQQIGHDNARRLFPKLPQQIGSLAFPKLPQAGSLAATTRA